MSEQQKDLVLNPNEYAYVLDRTKGNVNCYVGPTKTSLSNTDSPVLFNPETKRFDECLLAEANKLFVTAPENWYVALKNPETTGKHPAPRTVNDQATLDIGKKVNIAGPISFALYPGQMAKVIQGHRLRSNQYLLARVYDEEAANKNDGVVKTEEDAEVPIENLVVGKVLVIKGTEVSFYIPPTGIEVIPYSNGYVRDAVTLERLEYCILKDENGNKRYVNGPAVVFPEPTETFLKNDSGDYKFRAIELSKISGIYIKVIADYKDNNKEYKIGDELFITGDDQMIYYPRPEHSIITYDGQIVHHAVAIPSGEGRYVMNRLTGKIETIKGPAMFLPDPRTQVIVKRKLTKKQATLWYPNNEEVLRYNVGVKEQESVVDKFAKFTACVNTDSLEISPASAMKRKTKYTPLRTITLDNKFEGVVSVDVWTGYAIDVVSKDGTRNVVVGPQTVLLDYDQTLEVLEMSTGKPKTTDRLISDVYLRVANNKVSDIIRMETKDFVKVDIKVSYCVDFLEKYKDNWFAVENYVKFMCDRMRSIAKREAKNYTIEAFYNNASDIIRKVVLGAEEAGTLFEENGMFIKDVEVLSVNVEEEVAYMLQEHQQETVRKSIQQFDAVQRIALTKAIADSEAQIAAINNATMNKKLELENELTMKRLALRELQKAEEHKQALASLEADKKEQAIKDAIKEAERQQERKNSELMMETKKQMVALKKQENDAYAASVSKMMESISPQLSAAIQTYDRNSNMADIMQSISPMAIVNGKSIADTANQLLKGTALEGILETMLPETVVEEDDE